ncbi:uncharacterized protein [Diabrotica undecimpunctata]|uniref:uncharacterized protein n=1 Tax=Diabrotica undecimpunctata TaxID=50387 RepID=UPI003B63D1DE
MAENGGDVGGIPNVFGKEGNIPTTEELLKMLEGMSELSEENKQELRESILRGGLAREAENLADSVKENVASGGVLGEFTVLFIFISIVFLILVFFGYKLYSSLMEKERRKEEKKRQRQQKKKK